MKSGVISLDDVRGSDVLASWFYRKYKHICDNFKGIQLP